MPQEWLTMRKSAEPQSVGDNCIIARSGRMAGRDPPKGEVKPVGIWCILSGGGCIITTYDTIKA
jgi:hypothetical protein